jgi:hypothetical protein
VAVLSVDNTGFASYPQFTLQSSSGSRDGERSIGSEQSDSEPKWGLTAPKHLQGINDFKTLCVDSQSSEIKPLN